MNKRNISARWKATFQEVLIPDYYRIILELNLFTKVNSALFWQKRLC